MKLPVQKIKLTLAISWAVLSYTQVQVQPVNSQVLASPPPPTPNIGELVRRSEAASHVFVAPPPPPDIGEPGQRSEAGSRGCGVVNKQLTALVPVYSNSQLVFGTTIAEYPTVWFYIPYQQQFPAKFVLEEKEGKLVYQTDIRLPQSPGVISLSLPKTIPPLSIGKQYHWYLQIYCKEQSPPAFAEGWIQRNTLSPALKSQLEKATPRDRVTLYATNGIWFDALKTSGELHRRDPKDTSWTALLQTVGLNELATEPIAP